MACMEGFYCSEQGYCQNGVCTCHVQFAGENCTQTNISYTAAFSSIFSLLGLVSVIQLGLCIHSEYCRSKHPNIFSAFRVTTQKLLLGVAIAASFSRVLYFSLQGVIPSQWLIPVESAFHPILITGFSLVVCYWAETFFLETVSVDASRRACFLSKSFLAFSTFNVVLYIILLAHFVATGIGFYSPGSEEIWLKGVFQASFAILLFVVYVIFLTIGVEIFFKIRGAFSVSMESVESTSSCNHDIVDHQEIFKSRLALVFQALLTLLTVLCVVFAAAGNFWKYKVNLITKSTHEVIYRIAEVGAVLWFPCVLWNATCPEKLWFLNPRRLLKLTSDAGERLLSGQTSAFDVEKKNYNSLVQQSSNDVISLPIALKEPAQLCTGECWICYDPEREDAGDFIKPCLCKGGMAQVHHNCLRTWLLQHPDPEQASCKVCKHKYSVEKQKIMFGTIVCNSKRAILMIPSMLVAVLAPCASLLIFLLCNTLQTYVKIIVVGATFLLELIAFKILGINFSKLYQVSRIYALRIFDYTSSSGFTQRDTCKVPGSDGVQSISQDGGVVNVI